jgi:hypothetical protein
MMVAIRTEEQEILICRLLIEDVLPERTIILSCDEVVIPTIERYESQLPPSAVVS